MTQTARQGLGAAGERLAAVAGTAGRGREEDIAARRS
jgi:hypothetical protein